MLGHSSRCLCSFAISFLQGLCIVFRIVWKIVAAAHCCRGFLLLHNLLFRLSLRCRGINRHGWSFPLPSKSSQFPFVFIVARHRCSFVVITCFVTSPRSASHIITGVIVSHILMNLQSRFFSCFGLFLCCVVLFSI